MAASTPIGQTMPGASTPAAQQQPLGAAHSKASMAKGAPPGAAAGGIQDSWNAPVGGPPPARSPPPEPPRWSCKIIVNFEKLHPGFPTIAKIVGPDEANVKHIRETYGCFV